MGQIDLIAGPVAERDQWVAEYQIANGNVVDIRTLYDGTKLQEVRGPPSARKVYIIGEVRRVSTPEAFGASRVDVDVVPLDLRPRVQDVDRYLEMQRRLGLRDRFSSRDEARGTRERSGRSGFEYHPPVEHPVHAVP